MRPSRLCTATLAIRTLLPAGNQSMTLPAWPATVEDPKAQGFELFSSALRRKDFRFVFDRNKTSQQQQSLFGGSGFFPVKTLKFIGAG